MPQQPSPFKDIALWPLPHIAIVSAMGMIFGFDLGAVFINHNVVSDFYLIADSRSDIVTGTYILGFIFGVFIAGYVTYGSGRKISIISSITVGSLAIFASLVAPDYSILLCSELVIGFSFGLYLISALLYNCEIMLPNKRGLSLMMIPISILIGTLFSFISDDDLYTNPFMVFIVFFLINVVLVSIATVKLHESPRYLALIGSSDAALSVLFKLRHDMGMAARELAEINECCRGESRGFEFFLQNTIYRRLLAFLCITTFLFNIGGVTIIPYILMDNISLKLVCESAQNCYFTLNNNVVYITFGVAFIAVLLHALASEHNKRRLVVLYSYSLGIVFLFIAALVSMFESSAIFQFALLVSLLLFIIFTFGAFVIFITVISIELMPIRGREFGIAAIFLSHGLGVLVSINFYAPMLHLYGFTGLLTFGALVSLVVLYFCYLYLPNPGKISLENIESRILSSEAFSKINQTPTTHH